MLRLRKPGGSLFSVMLVSIAGVTLAVYLVTRFLLPDEPNRSIPLADRFTVDYLVEALREGGGPIVVFILMVVVTIWIVLQRTLAPVRDLSERARRIGPANLDARLPVAQAPAEIVPLVEAVNTSLDRLEDAWKAQRAFSANAAHELRTPLAALRAQVESLLPAQHRGEAAEEFDRLSRIIAQLLVLSEGEHGPLRRTSPLDLVEVVANATTECAPDFLRSGRNIGLEATTTEAPRQGDAVLVGAAIRNLLDNALKHTPVGTQVTVGVDAAGLVSVADNGPGLSPEFAARAFQPFTRADARSAGAGLGLSIVSRIAQLHGGSAWLESSGKGAVFKLHIPPHQGAAEPTVRA